MKKKQLRKLIQEEVQRQLQEEPEGSCKTCLNASSLAYSAMFCSRLDKIVHKKDWCCYWKGINI